MKKGFTLAEVLITLAIIGVVAAISIPSVISNSQQQEFKTGLKKAVSVLNSAITMNIALDGESPYDNVDLFNYLQRHMSVMKQTKYLPWRNQLTDKGSDANINSAFYTTDGMRYEFIWRTSGAVIKAGMPLHESDVLACFAKYDTYTLVGDYNQGTSVACGGCGSYGLKNNPNGTTKPPCAILVDVNGDRKPTPSRVFSNYDDAWQGAMANNGVKYWIPDMKTKRIYDIFTILITESGAIPYGVVAQKAMYEAQK